MRTKRSFNNLISVTFFSLVIGILGFIKVRVFVNGLSSDIYSIHQLFYQIFGYLTIADIGFGLILNKNFYEAFAKDDKKLINKIYSTSKKFYNYIGVIMITASVIISFFVNYLTKADIDNGYIQIVFIIFIIRNVIDYFFVAPRFVMDADQKNYKINYLIKIAKIIEILVEIVLVLLGVNYLIVLLPAFFITLFVDLYINQKIYREYPFLKNDKSFNKEYLKGTKDLISLKLSGLMNSNTDIILISTFINPISVIIYTSYVYITKFVSDTIFLIANAITPSFANVINKDGTEKGYDVFNDLSIFFLFVAAFTSIMMYAFLNNLIVLWIGEKYIVSSTCLFLFILISFYNIADRSLVITINSKGLFKETKNIMLIEAILNIIISISLIFRFKLIGVLLGTIISGYTTTFIHNSLYLHKHIFKKSVIKYYLSYGLTLIICLLFMNAFYLLNITTPSVMSFIINVGIYSIIVALLLFIIYYLLFKDFRNLVERGKFLLISKKKKSS